MDAEIIKHLTAKQRKVYSILSNGRKHSAADISILTHFSDPRAIIRDLRVKGLQILDEWRVNAEKDGRYKVYYLNAVAKH